jgi:iron(II)-dependent oxidoreductase
VPVALLLVSAPVTPDTPVTEADEKPQRVVQLPDFYIDEFEISNIEYKRFIDATGYPPPPTWEDAQYEAGADFYPVTHVTWWDAVAYARWVGKRLPSEAEWEKAARGPEGRRYPWGEEFDAGLANAGDGYAPISSFLGGVSVYGAHNMAGNVAEWTSSTYEPYPELEAVLPTTFGGTDSENAAARPTREKVEVGDRGGRAPEPEDPRLKFFSVDELRDDRHRVYRGGSVNNYAMFLRSANREKTAPGSRWYNVGFRCARDAPRNADKR